MWITTNTNNPQCLDGQILHLSVSTADEFEHIQESLAIANQETTPISINHAGAVYEQ